MGLLGKILLGIAAGIAAAIIIKIVLIDKAAIQKKLREEALNHAIVKNIQQGNKKIVNVGLYDEYDNEEKNVTFEGDKIKDLREGMVIYA